MSQPRPGQKAHARRRLRQWKQRLRGAPRWAVRPFADPARLADAWAARGLLAGA